MIECPKCNRNMRGDSCQCGYKVERKRYDGWEDRQQRDKFADDRDHLTESRQWLLDQGIVTPGMTRFEHQKATGAYRRALRDAPMPDHLDWARRILQRMEDGDTISRLQERMAKEALGVE